MMTPKERFLLACGELGWGDANQGLWFVAIEEGSSWTSGDEERIERYYGHGLYFRDDAMSSGGIDCLIDEYSAPGTPFRRAYWRAAFNYTGLCAEMSGQKSR